MVVPALRDPLGKGLQQAQGASTNGKGGNKGGKKNNNNNHTSSNNIDSSDSSSEREDSISRNSISSVNSLPPSSSLSLIVDDSSSNNSRGSISTSSISANNQYHYKGVPLDFDAPKRHNKVYSYPRTGSPYNGGTPPAGRPILVTSPTFKRRKSKKPASRSVKWVDEANKGSLKEFPPDVEEEMRREAQLESARKEAEDAKRNTTREDDGFCRQCDDCVIC